MTGALQQEGRFLELRLKQQNAKAPFHIGMPPRDLLVRRCTKFYWREAVIPSVVTIEVNVKI